MCSCENSEDRLSPVQMNSQLQLTTAQIAPAVEYVSFYLREQHLSAARPLSNQRQARMWPYFSPTSLVQVRIVELHGRRLSPPAFYAQARALGFDNLPDVPPCTP